MRPQSGGNGGAVLLLVGIPAVLVRLAGWPLPTTMPSRDEFTKWLQQPLTPAFVTATLVIAVWLIWAALLGCAALEVYRWAARRHTRWPRLHLPRPVQAFTAALLGATAVTSSTAGATAAHATATNGDAADRAEPAHAGQHTTAVAAAPNMPMRAAASPAVERRTSDDRPTTITVRAGDTLWDLADEHLDNPATAAPTAAPPPAPRATAAPDLPRFALTAHTGPLTVAATGQKSVTVQRGDTLWDLADAWLGDPHRWREIYQINKDRYDRHGRMHGGHRIYPGQQLDIPDDATPPAGASPAGPADSEPPADPAPSTPTQPPPAPPASPPASTAPVSPPTSAGPTATPSTPATQTPGDDGDDGVAGIVPTPATPMPTSPSATASPPASSSPAEASPSRPDPSAQPGVTLTGDSWVDLGLALAIAAAATLVWRLRRRRYTPRPPSPELRLDDPDLPPMPQVVTAVRHGLRASDPDEDTSLDDLPDSSDGADTGELDTGADPEGEPADKTGGAAPAGPAPPLNVPALGNPMLRAWPPAGLGLTGPGAEAAARGFLASALASGGVDDPHGRARVVMPAATLATLLGAAAVNVPDTPRLSITGDLTNALETLEEQTLHRTRLVYGHEVDTLAQLRDTDPDEEPLAPILFLADAAVPHERARIAALLAQGQRLDIHGVLLGPWLDGDSVVVAADGATAPADGERSRHGSHPADVGRLAVLTATETAALLATLGESHTGLPQPPAPAEPQPLAPAPAAERVPAAAAVPAGPQVDGDSDATADGQAGTSEDAPAASGAAPTGDPAVFHGPITMDGEPPALPAAAGAGDDEPDLDDDTPDGPGLVTVRVLGRPAIVGADPNDSLRAKAMELLVYLIARGGGAITDAIVEDLVPDATVSKAPGRVHTYVYALRQALRRTGGRATYVTHPPHRYQLNRDAFEVDLWRMQEALAEAEAATTDQARVAALRRAVDAYAGPLAAGARYEWAEPYREAVCRQALDAHLALADALTVRPGQALAVLDAAISHDPYAEPLYQAAMRRHADLGDADAIRDRLAELTHRLEEIDTEPTDETAALAGQLREDVAGRAHRGPRRDRGAAA